MDAALQQDVDRWQGFSFQEFQESAAAGRNVADLVGDLVFCNRGQGIAATGDREALGLGDGQRQGLGALGELVEFEDTDRTVPDDGAGLLELLGQLRSCLLYTSPSPRD